MVVEARSSAARPASPLCPSPQSAETHCPPKSRVSLRHVPSFRANQLAAFASSGIVDLKRQALQEKHFNTTAALLSRGARVPTAASLLYQNNDRLRQQSMNFRSPAGFSPERVDTATLKRKASPSPAPHALASSQQHPLLPARATLASSASTSALPYKHVGAIPFARAQVLKPSAGAVNSVFSPSQYGSAAARALFSP